MHFTRTDRGFEVVPHPVHAADPPRDSRLVQQSSVIGNYVDAMQRPGSSALWIGENHHLVREEVAALRDRLQAWLDTGSLRLVTDAVE